jgi:uncharacterized membrane protein HdeD (DUF308 family)
MERTPDDRGWNNWGAAIAADLLAKNWWALVLRGVAGIVFGILAFVMPVVTLAALLLLFGAYALVDGIFNIVAAATGGRGARPWWALLLAGLAGIGAGLVTFVMPGLTALALAYLIGIWAIVTGVLEIVAAVRLRKEIRNEWLLGLSGALAVAFGALLLFAPGAGALAMVLWIGAYALVYGALLVFLGFRLRGRRPEARDTTVRRAA